MRELALNVLDISENSLSAKAKLIQITLDIRFSADTFSITIEDDGCGMSEEMLARVTDPFTTTRTTRKVGMGLPLFRYSAESTGGSFSITSKVGEGTRVCALYHIGHIDRIPLGDFGGVALQLITMNPNTDFVISVKDEDAGQAGVLDTREFRAELGDIPFTEPEVRAFIKDYIQENLVNIYGGRL